MSISSFSHFIFDRGGHTDFASFKPLTKLYTFNKGFLLNWHLISYDP